METGAVTDLFYLNLEAFNCGRICLKQPPNSQQRFITSVQLFISLVFLLSNEKGCALSGPGHVPSEATGLNCQGSKKHVSFTCTEEKLKRVKDVDVFI